MKRLTLMLAVLFFMLPSISLAAGLTSQQSSSLIAVVQSSPGTPASAFVSLITAFSNITINQATSLIVVVQAAPGVPANAFVNLLTSFTVDTSAILEPKTPDVAFQAVPQASTAPIVQPVGCIEAPRLILSLATTTQAVNEVETFVFAHPKARYSTGCPLKPETPYSYKVTGGNPIWQGYRNDHGTIVYKYEPGSSTFEDWNENDKSYHTWVYVPKGSYPEYPNAPITFSMSVGNTSEQISEYD
ncbi:MAG: hypothetical protein NT108_03635 [Candidatus Kaiserbacteria bacterium]|nr:hypothetical protein [Candidatus Kaiserbacteria bacterium]